MSKKDNTIPKGYKRSPFGLIPEDWNHSSFGNFADFKNGLNFTKEDRGKGIKIIGVGDFLNHSTISYDQLDKVEVPASISKEYLLKENDLLFVRSNGNKELVGRNILIKNLHEEISHSGFTIRARVDRKKGLPEFYSLVFKSSLVRKQYLTLGGGTNISNLSQDILASIIVPFPTLKEQTAIANLLSTWDKAINALTQLIAQKEQRKKWLMQQLLTGKKRLKGFEKVKWEKIGAGEIFKSVSIKGNLNEQLLSATQDKGMIPREMLEARVTMPKGETDSFKLVEKGDFVISLRSFQGGLEYSEYRGLVSPAYTVLKSQKKIVKDFYRYYFKSYDFIGHLAVAVIGIRDGKQISYDDFCFVNIPYPSTDEQKAISLVLGKADEELKLLQIKCERLKNQKKGLMQILLTGKKRLHVK